MSQVLKSPSVTEGSPLHHLSLVLSGVLSFFSFFSLLLLAYAMRAASAHLNSFVGSIY